ncbi:MAG: hypothetical protein NT011_10860 [Kiritimatiellaeota bacterium]|nr:hypothetical protein [Kiritimatiellota bacterium]
MDDQQSTRWISEWMIKGHRRTITLIAALALAAPAALAAATWMLYGSACSDWWYADDAAHLWFVMRHDQIWQYFAVPEVSRAASAHLVPWVFMLYRLIYVCCGMEHPGTAYALQLLSLFAVAWMTRVLLGLWVCTAWAWLGAFLFLLGAPVMHVAHELMTVNYVQGLFFALIAAYGFVRAIRNLTWWPAVAGGFCYLLAVTAKEIYVPLPMLLLFLPENTWKQRGLKALPFLIVLTAYVPWRWFMLDTLVGGYQSQTSGPGIVPVCQALRHVPVMILGADGLGWGVMIAGLLGLMLLVGLSWRKIVFGLVGLCALLGPLVPLTQFPGLVSPGRYLFVVWWGMTAACVLVMERLSCGRHWRGHRWQGHRWLAWVALALWVAISLAAGREMRREQRQSQSWIDSYETQGRFLWAAASDRIFLIRPPFHVARFVAAIKQKLAGAGSAPIVIDDQADLEIQTRLGLVAGAARSNATVWAYNESGRRMEEITGEFRQQQAESPARVQESALRIDLQFERQAMRWRFGPYEQGNYLMVRLAEGRIIDRIHFLPEGQRDATGGGVFDFFLRYDSPEGWTTYSPVLRFDRQQGGVVWRRD